MVSQLLPNPHGDTYYAVSVDGVATGSNFTSPLANPKGLRYGHEDAWASFYDENDYKDEPWRVTKVHSFAAAFMSSTGADLVVTDAGRFLVIFSLTSDFVPVRAWPLTSHLSPLTACSPALG